MSASDRVASVIRDVFLDRLGLLKESRTVVALSGGVDSCAVLAGLLEAGSKPVVVSYTPSTHESTDFQMARETAGNCELEFVPAVVDMSSFNLDFLARYVIGLGYKSKVQVESLAPMVEIASTAALYGDVMLTGDQSDGYFCLSKWAAHNYDRSIGVPYKDRSRNVKEDTSSDRIDAIRDRYFINDLSCSGAVRSVCESFGMKASFPFRNERVREAFRGTLWSEVNEPRIKEPIRIAFQDEFEKFGIQVRPVQVNLHKGDSGFGDAITEAMMTMYPGYATARGLYSAISKGLV